MKRYAVLTMMGAILASVIGVSEAGAHHQCGPAQPSYSYCGEHPRLASLPMRFRLNLNSAPAGLSEAKVLAAVDGAIQEWNRAWPLGSGDLLCEVLCLDATPSSSTGPSRDGVNTISWSSSFGGCSGDHDGIAVACIWYEGSSGAKRHRIDEVDIVLSATKDWYQPRLSGGPQEALQWLAGDVAGLHPEVGNRDDWDVIGGGKGRYDLQSVLTHEFGHALGLGDIGSETAPWPQPLISDTPSYQQTMYRWYYRGTTNKRSLGDGDIAGLMRIAIDTAIDGNSET